MHKVEKGQFGYIRYERFARSIRTLVLFLLPMIAYVIGWIVHGTTRNIITVLSMVFMIPACLSAVSLIMMYTIRPTAATVYQRSREAGPDLTHAYELYLTNYDKNVLLDAVSICGDQVVCLATYKSPSLKDGRVHIENLLRQAGIRATITMTDQEEGFLDQVRLLQDDRENIRANTAPVSDERYPEDTLEMQILHVLRSASL